MILGAESKFVNQEIAFLESRPIMKALEGQFNLQWENDKLKSFGNC